MNAWRGRVLACNACFDEVLGIGGGDPSDYAPLYSNLSITLRIQSKRPLANAGFECHGVLKMVTKHSVPRGDAVAGTDVLAEKPHDADRRDPVGALFGRKHGWR